MSSHNPEKLQDASHFKAFHAGVCHRGAEREIAEVPDQILIRTSTEDVLSDKLEVFFLLAKDQCKSLKAKTSISMSSVSLLVPISSPHPRCCGGLSPQWPQEVPMSLFHQKKT